MKRFILAFACVILLLAASGCDSSSLEIGNAAPDLKVESLAKPGEFKKLTDFKGKVVVIDFWGTYCGPCKELMPNIESLYEDFGSKGLEVMAISNEERDVIQKFRNSTPNYKYPLYIDEFQLANHAYQVTGIPVTVVVGRSGKIVYADTGYSPDSPRKIREAVIKALG